MKYYIAKPCKKKAIKMGLPKPWPFKDECYIVKYETNKGKETSYYYSVTTNEWIEWYDGLKMLGVIGWVEYFSDVGWVVKEITEEEAFIEVL